MILRKLCFFLIISSLAFAQTNGANNNSSSNSNSDASSLTEEVKQMRAIMAEQQKQLLQQQHELEELRQKVNAQAQPVSANGTVAPKIINASLNANLPNASAQPASDAPLQDQDQKAKESPLSFKIGGADFTPGGFLDFTAFFRSVNTTNTGGTNFFSIPFSNTIQGHITETRFTAQNSRISLKAHGNYLSNDITGYVEADFLGNDAANVFVTSNSHTFRQRLYFVDVKHGKWEVLAGQSWGWLTPNRVGLSPYPSDVFYTQDMDFNYQVGLTWTRAPQVRFVYHPNSNWAIGVAAENPQQFVGQGNEVAFPFLFNAQVSPQFDAANNPGTPNLHPDIIPKFAYDTDVAGKHFHWEAAGLLTTKKITNLAAGSFTSHTKTGWGVESAINFELVKNFRLVSNGFYSAGGGRYIFGMGPDAVVGTNAAGNDLTLSLVHSGSGIAGFEWQIAPKTMIYSYYGGAYFQRNAFIDITNPVPNRFAGFGGPNSPNSANRAIQEGTVGWIQTFWKNPQYGALQLITQASYLTRAPWFVAAGAPKNAHLGMGWVDIRYVLP